MQIKHNWYDLKLSYQVYALKSWVINHSVSNILETDPSSEFDVMSDTAAHCIHTTEYDLSCYCVDQWGKGHQ
jgi:hypothetical protein